MTQPKRHVLTVALEDYFQVGAFNRVIQRGQWYRFETRLERNAERTLALLDRHNVKATFFVLGWIADQFPELVRKVAERGHEIASKGYYHRGISQMTPAEFRDDLLRSREALEHACGRKVIGYRVADSWFRPEDLWALDVLSDVGYRYDSSIAPIGRAWAHEPFRRFMHVHESRGKQVVELPISTSGIFGFQVPIAGGNYFRQLPPLLIRRAIARWDRKFEAPLVLYFHVW
jgi:polysaccharide deacetylase family protein (PEP-CTERM system associated)